MTPQSRCDHTYRTCLAYAVSHYTDGTHHRDHASLDVASQVSELQYCIWTMLKDKSAARTAWKELTGTFSWPGAGCEAAVLFVRPARVAVLVSLCFCS